MTAHTSDARYRERLLPGPGFFGAWLLLIPAVWLIMLPINKAIGLPVAIGIYAIVAVTFFALSPVIQVSEGVLQAGRATIKTDLIGEIEPLGSQALHAAIGPGADARNYLVVRGWIHRGLKLEIADESDPTPSWIITSRKPLALADAIAASR